MVAPLSASLTAPLTGSGAQGADPQEAARIKAEILSTRNELQCATCEGDKATLKEQISTLETRLRQVETTSRVEPAQATGESADPARTGEDGGPSVLIDPQTADRASEAGREGDVATLGSASSAQEGVAVSVAGAASEVREGTGGAFAYGANGRADIAVAGPVAPGGQLDISV